MNRKQRRTAQAQQTDLPANLFAKALALHQSGNLKEAETLYKSILVTSPANADVLGLLGAMRVQQDSLEEALRLLERAIASGTSNPEIYHNYGYVLNQLGRYADAVASYDKAIALNPANAGSLNSRGNALNYMGRYEEALASYVKALALNPSYAEAYCNCGHSLHGLKRYDEALANYDKAIALIPNYAEAYNSRAISLHKLKRYVEALANCDKALAIAPDYTMAHSNRGNILSEMKRYDEALACFDKAIALTPDYAEAHNNRGTILKRLGRYAEALENFEKAIALKADYADAHYNRGVALHTLQQLDGAVESYDRAIALKPGFADAYWNKALSKLTLGEFEDGWKLHEWRWKRTDLDATIRAFEKPMWLGQEDLAGKTLFLYAEQGWGDTIQFCRYIPMIEQLGAKVVLEAPAALHSLLSTLPCSPFLKIANATLTPGYDFHCPLMSLPLAFGTTLSTIPAQVPYLHADDAKRSAWQQRLGAKTKPRIGLVWSGALIHKNDRNRSIALEQFVPLLERGFEFHSLQKEVRPEDAVFLAQSIVASHKEELKDFSDTAALASEMDLIVSVDTSVAHLAGALGKPVWILLPFVPDFRWLLGREDSPWYPTARLFRQPRHGEWKEIIERVSSEATQKFSV